MAEISYPPTKDLTAVLSAFPQLREDRTAICEQASGVASDGPLFLAEYHGTRVEDSRVLKSELTQALIEAGMSARVELVRAGWMSLDASGAVCPRSLAAKHAEMRTRQKQAAIEDGSFAILTEEQKDCFGYFGSLSKIRTPAEIFYPSRITVGNWVSLGRYGKVVMLPDEAFAGQEKYVAQHYPELVHTFDFEGYETGREANLYLGDGTTLGDRYFIICTQSVEFGKHIMASANLFVSDCHHIYEDTEIPPALLPATTGRPVRIEDHVWIGINCCILEGVTIGRHAVVAANSVVKEDVPPYTLVAGAPAKVKKEFRPKSTL